LTNPHEIAYLMERFNMVVAHGGTNHRTAATMNEQTPENGLLYGLEMPSSYAQLEEESVKTIAENLKGYPKALRFFEMLRADEETTVYLSLANYIAVRKLGYNDHGPIHARIVTANGLRILKLVMESEDLALDSTTGLGLSEDDAHLIVAAACFLHDIGNAIHREEHEMFSVIIAKDILDRLLPELYPDLQSRIEVTEQILHALTAHDEADDALTIESAIVVIADGCDITKGRGRLAFDLGKHDIHSVSALSIESVEIVKGKTMPIKIHVKMSNSAGIYQLQETLGKKVANSPLRDHIEIVAELTPSKAQPEMRILDRIVFSGGKYRSGRDS
jgi:metal-dependent HD superfamily phosphatase/phosphodiesterase